MSQFIIAGMSAVVVQPNLRTSSQKCWVLNDSRSTTWPPGKPTHASGSMPDMWNTGNDAVVDVVAGEVDPRLVRPQPPPRHEHALRRAGGARRVADARDVVALGHREVGGGRRRVPQRLRRDERDREVGRELVGAGVGHDHQLEQVELGRDLGETVEVLTRAQIIRRARELVST